MHKTLVPLSLLALTLAACGGGAATTSSSSSTGTAASSSGAAVSVASTSLGRVLVDSHGHTLYMLTADSRGHSTCNAQCLAYWPAVAVPKSLPHAFAGVTATVSSTALPSGGRTLTAGGLPLYTFIKDQKPGDVTGQGLALFGGTWYAVSPSGHSVTSMPSKASQPSPSTGGGYGY